MSDVREQLTETAHDLFGRGLTHGATGNLSIRDGDSILVTPTGSRLDQVDPGALSVLDLDGSHLSGPRPTKEAFLHAAFLRARPSANAVVHTHSPYSAAVSCLDGLDPDDALPPLTAYYAMRVGRLPLLSYHAPGDDRLGPLAEAAARRHHAVLLSNHGPVVAGAGMAAAVDALEELEHCARLYLLLDGRSIRPLSREQADALRPTD